MSGFAKLTGKALRALAEEYEVQLPAGRITKGKLIEILEAENIQPPWGGPEWKCPTPASLMSWRDSFSESPPGRSGGQFKLAGRIMGQGEQAAMARTGSESIVGISRKRSCCRLSDSPDHSGRSGDLG